jgi:HK97 family phage prohead protease
MERKFIDLKELKVSDEGPGTIEGYRAVFGELDQGGDILVKGAFADSHAEYMHSGFSAHSHIWDFKDAVGYPVEAYEDDHGWFVKSEFHTTQGAQDVRTIARERMQAGKQVGFSFGYKTDAFQFIEQKDFAAELPKYITAERLAENMKKAQSFSRIRILKKVSAIEDSLVTAPMNKLAAATGVKSVGESVEGKGLFEDVIADCEQSLYFLCDKLQTAIYRAQMLDEYAEDTGTATFDLPGALQTILSEFSTRVIAAVTGDDVEEDTGSGEIATAGFSGPMNFKGDLRDRLPFAKHAEAVLGAVEVFAKRGAAVEELVNELSIRRKTIIELREAKAGAVYSGSNSSHMQRIHDAIGKVKKTVGAIHSDMAALIAKGEKPKKADDTPELDTAALRAQSLRVQSQALMN